MQMPKTRTAPVALSPRVDYASRDYWAGTIKMGLSKFFILRVLHDGPMHGYDVARSVERTTGGCCSPTEGTIYPVLRGFEAGGFVTVEEEVVQGRLRRVYALTETGRAAFRVALEAWMEATTALQNTGRAFAAADRARAKRRSGGECCT
jgi:PadR family transcriptional regulator PadR